MEVDNRERLLRLRFGPTGDAPRPKPPVRARVPKRLLAGAAVLIVAVGSIGAFLLLTPREHVAPGCWWWTAGTVGHVVAGDRGCLRGFYRGGASLTEGSSESDVSIPIAYNDPDQQGGRLSCAFAPGDAVVVRYHAVFDDGRTVVVIESCR